MAMTELLLFFLFTSTVLVHAQQGFISIDCGIPEGFSYTDDETGIFYASDAGFIHSGENSEFPSSNPVASSLKRQCRTMRSFPEGGRNCYTVRPVQKGSRYFLRASFMYVNYEEVQEAPEFDLYVGINLWTAVSLTNASLPWWTEILVLAPRDFIPVCLVNTGKGDPFISALEVRLVNDAMYTEASYNQSLRAMWLYDAGSTSEKIIRYPEDGYDRLWVPYTNPSWVSISTSLTVENTYYYGYEPPSAVMQTAATPLNANDSLYFNWTANDPGTEFQVFTHHADFQKSKGNATLREIDCCSTGFPCYPFTTEYLVVTSIYAPTPMTGDRNYFVSFSKTNKSVLPPILNAFEIYLVLSLNEATTDEQDVHAMMRIKDVYGLQKNWMGDPCLPKEYLWNGLHCSYDDDQHPTARIISLNLSSSGLTGEIDESFGNLKLISSLDLSRNNLTGPIPSFLAKLSLSHLDLSDNNLTGSVPEFLVALIFLTYLNLSHNQLSGSVPMSLVDKAAGGSLTLSVDPNICNLASCHATDPCAIKPCKKSLSVKVPVLVVVVAVASVAVGIAGSLIWFKCRRKRAATPNCRSTLNGGGSFNFENRRFSFDEIATMTNDFERVLGRGGFGTVYHGQMKDGKEIAVKMLSQNVHSSTEFQTEVQLLMTVYHRHLVRFIGYCANGDNTALILEYMARGNLRNLLPVQDEKEILSWDQRLHIALDVAQGLEYLHVFCKPPIIHRDVKAANILLNENLEAKLADFGICKVFSDDHHTHITTQVRGTHGYLDPEYFISNNLNEKSDVYGYGVVLLELITGRPAITQTHDNSQKISLVEWVSPFVPEGDVTSIIDPKLQADNYNDASAWRVLNLAISCTQPRAVQRPSISRVVVQLKECLEVDKCTDGSTGMGNDEFETQSSSSVFYIPR